MTTQQPADPPHSEATSDGAIRHEKSPPRRSTYTAEQRRAYRSLRARVLGTLAHRMQQSETDPDVRAKLDAMTPAERATSAKIRRRFVRSEVVNEQHQLRADRWRGAEMRRIQRRRQRANGSEGGIQSGKARAAPILERNELIRGELAAGKPPKRIAADPRVCDSKGRVISASQVRRIGRTPT